MELLTVFKVQFHIECVSQQFVCQLTQALFFLFSPRQTDRYKHVRRYTAFTIPLVKNPLVCKKTSSLKKHT